MDIKQSKEELFQSKLVAIFRGVPTDKAGSVAQALAKGGIQFFEICLNQSSNDIKRDFEEQFYLIKNAIGDNAHIGAGTVITTEQVDMVSAIGGEMIVSPCTDEAVIRRTKELGMISIPGAMTPSEINKAYLAGADLVKLYVVEDPHYVQMLKGPLGHIPMQITCNVSEETIPAFLKAGIKAFGTKAMLPDPLINAEDYAAITEKAKSFVNTIRQTN